MHASQDQQLFEDFYADIIGSPLSHWLQTAPAQLARWQKEQRHGELDSWLRVVSKLPELSSASNDLKHSVTFGSEAEASNSDRARMTGLLKQLMPWRKGPFQLYGMDIDTEWRSDWKWERLLPHISSLTDRNVLDVGCGSGYHMWRMLGEGAARVIGVDPTQLFLVQFLAIKHFAPKTNPIHLLPLGIQELPELKAFDTVFSMGVLYHRRSPIDHLFQLKSQLRPGGELVLETLVIDGDKDQVLVPGERYAQMPNVWFVPSSEALEHWLERCGMVNIRTVDINVTTVDEQRSTDWMDRLSLNNYLDRNDQSKTVEGHPAPKRSIIIANRPE
ncbi:tRNA 5-methoxyuridine(34)/uridine 5-oxyacetic acid(34) synthase CmoB [Corallincola spongiicola]|uniref:tRNA U34 carboxymethyltransferase n=1 Tax=Corallincola spongiicola TaxID=2520508 RepID=A0ABY1WSK5_9GAMM|nr:tRNA 5-methoxyuridine(34)/uridine 5-oxyacetic acid(34) synthase CmoB [Corallincola spongiicola]TAA47725.1 tRNA 5-methoxyuridine(34)/uridine 5-oxyacetic acid(34) synthase CmoB [Corallincola spongiicola]